MLRLLRETRRAVMWRQFAVASDKRANLELDAFDNPYVDTEASRPHYQIMQHQEAFPRRKLKELYIYALERFKDLPATASYRIFMEELTRYRLKVVEDNESIESIEQIIAYGKIDDLIEAAKNELTCIDHMKREKPWEPRAIDSDSFEDRSIDALFGEHPFQGTQEKPKKN